MKFNVPSRLAAALTLGVLLAACGDDTPATPTPSPTPTPAPPPAQVLSYQPVWELETDFYIVEEFTIPGPGEITATVQWQSGDNNVDVFLTKAPCSARQFFGKDKKCKIYDKDEAPSRKPAVARFTAGAEHAGGARIWVLNHGPSAEKGSFLIERQPPQ